MTAPSSPPVHSSDGQPLNHIALLEYVARNADSLAASNPDAAKFIPFYRHGFAVHKGYPSVISAAHSTVLIRVPRTLEGTLKEPIPFCYVADPTAEPPGAQFDPNGPEVVTPLDANLVARLVALGGQQTTNDNDAARDAAAASARAASDATLVAQAATSSSAGNAGDLAAAAVAARGQATTDAAAVIGTLTLNVTPFLAGSGADKKYFGRFVLAPEAVHEADEAGARLFLSFIDDPTRREELRRTCLTFGGGGLAMALYLFRAGRAVGILEQNILSKRFRAISSAPFADLTPQTVRQHYEALDVANESLPNGKRFNALEMGETVLTTLLSTSEDLYNSVQQKLQISCATVHGFTLSGCSVKDTIILILSERAQREEFLSKSTLGSANLAGSPRKVAAEIKKQRAAAAAAAAAGTTDPSKTYDKTVRSRDDDGNPRPWLESAGLCKHKGKANGCSDGRHWHKDCTSKAQSDLRASRGNAPDAAKVTPKRTGNASLSAQVEALSTQLTQLAALSAASVPAVAPAPPAAPPTVLSLDSSKSSNAPSVVGGGLVASSVAASDFLTGNGECQSITAEALLAFVNAQQASPSEVAPASPPPSPPNSESGDELAEEPPVVGFAHQAYYGGDDPDFGSPPERFLYVVSTLGTVDGKPNEGIWYGTTGGPDHLNRRVFGLRPLPSSELAHGITACASLLEAVIMCELRGITPTLRGYAPYIDSLSDVVYPEGAIFSSHSLVAAPPSTETPRCVRADCPCTSTWNAMPGEHCGLTCRNGQPCLADFHPARAPPPPTPPVSFDSKDHGTFQEPVRTVVYHVKDSLIELPFGIDISAVNLACRDLGDAVFQLLAVGKDYPSVGGDVFKPNKPNCTKTSNNWLQRESPAWVRSLLNRPDVHVVGDQLKALTWLCTFAATARPISDSVPHRRSAVDAMRLHLTRLAELLGGCSPAPIMEALVPVSYFVLRVVRIARGAFDSGLALGLAALRSQASLAFPDLGRADGSILTSSSAAASLSAISAGLTLYHDPGACLRMASSTISAAPLFLPAVTLLLLLVLVSGGLRRRSPSWQAKPLNSSRAETYRARGDWSPQRPPSGHRSHLGASCALVAPARSYRFPLCGRLQHSISVGSPPWLLLLLVVLWLGAAFFDATACLSKRLGLDLNRRRGRDVFSEAATISWLRCGCARGVTHRTRTLLSTPRTLFQLFRFPFGVLRFALLHLGHRLARGATRLSDWACTLFLEISFVYNMLSTMLDGFALRSLLRIPGRLARGGTYTLDFLASSISDSATTTPPVCAIAASSGHLDLLPAAAVVFFSLFVSLVQALATPPAAAHSPRLHLPATTSRLDAHSPPRAAAPPCLRPPSSSQRRHRCKRPPSSYHRPPPQRCPVNCSRQGLARLCGYALQGAVRGHAALSSLVRPDGRKVGSIPAVVDSGCTFHAHPDRRHLTNLRACNDLLIDANGTEHKASLIGDLRACVTDDKSRVHSITLHNVRYVPTFVSTLISVKQLWDEQGLDSRFRSDMMCLTADASSAGLGQRHFPLSFRQGLYVWDVLPGTSSLLASAASGNLAPQPAAGSACVGSGFHKPHDGKRVSRLSSELSAEIMHMRLHGGIEAMRRLPSMVADSPPGLANTRVSSCAHCVEANATRHSHTGVSYSPSYPGRNAMQT